MPERACDKCGVHANVGQNRRLALLLDGGLSVERVLCLRCLDDVLAAITDACRPIVHSNGGELTAQLRMLGQLP